MQLQWLLLNILQILLTVFASLNEHNPAYTECPSK